MFVEFSQNVHEAEGTAENALIGTIQTASEADWKAAGWLLARRFGWIDQSRTTVTHEGTIHTTSVAVIASTSLPDLYRLLAGAGGLIDHAALPMPTAEPESTG